MRRSLFALVLFLCLPSLLRAQASLTVCANGCDYSNLQTAINAAQPGDTLLLRAGETFTGNFTLPDKGSSTDVITLRSDADDADLPGPDQRIDPSYAPFLPKIRSGNTGSAMTAAPGAHHYRLMFLEFQGNSQGYNVILSLGVLGSPQTSLAAVPHDLTLDRLYIHGDDFYGQKRCIGLESASTSILSSYISNCKGVAQDTQAIGSNNGPGPYLIENNYLEAAGENIMFGGADPTISGLIPTDITIRRNHFFKPVAWRSPILGTPQGVAATSSITGGTLASDTYGYRVQAIATNHYQGTTIQSSAAAQVTATVPTLCSPTGSVTITWQPVANATHYRVYGRTPGSPERIWTVTGTSFTDDGTGGTAGGAPGGGTVWLVKNLFELKNAKDVTVYGNVMENNWVNGQAGYAIVLTPRNQSGGCTWCTVENVTLSYNIIRHSAGGANILGTDNNHPSGRIKNLTFSNNLFYDLTSAWGTGTQPWLLIQAGPEDVTIDHNTVHHPLNSQIYLGGTPKIQTLIVTNNLMKRGNYGVFSPSGEGTVALNGFATTWTFRRNAIAGAASSFYPADNYFPSVTNWENEFESFATDVYRLKPTSSYLGLGTDGLDLGVDYDGLLAATAGVIAP